MFVCQTSTKKIFLNRGWAGGVQKVWQFTKHTSKACISGIYMPRGINRVNILQQRVSPEEYSNKLQEAISKTDPEELL